MKFLCLFLLLSTAAMARPDYFPTPAKGEWNYQLTAGGQMAQRTRRVVSQVTRLPGGGEEIVVRDTTPTEILTTYRKVGGWVYCDRTVTPSVQSTFDYDKDLTELKIRPRQATNGRIRARAVASFSNKSGPAWGPTR